MNFDAVYAFLAAHGIPAGLATGLALGFGFVATMLRNPGALLRRRRPAVDPPPGDGSIGALIAATQTAMDMAKGAQETAQKAWTATLECEVNRAADQATCAAEMAILRGEIGGLHDIINQMRLATGMKPV